MVEYAKNNQIETPADTQPRTVTDVVCPVCFKPLPYPQVLMEGIDNETGLTVRTYFGWCFECNRGFAVVQFKRGERWVIYKYQEYYNFVVGVKRDTDWIVLNEPPRPPKQKDEKTVEVLKNMLDSLRSICEGVQVMLNDLADKRG